MEPCINCGKEKEDEGYSLCFACYRKYTGHRNRVPSELWEEGGRATFKPKSKNVVLYEVEEIDSEECAGDCMVLADRQLQFHCYRIINKQEFEQIKMCAEFTGINYNTMKDNLQRPFAVVYHGKWIVREAEDGEQAMY